jgi:hypothetical protein
MQVLARRKTGVMLREQTTPGTGEDCPFLLVFVATAAGKLAYQVKIWCNQ